MLSVRCLIKFSKGIGAQLVAEVVLEEESTSVIGTWMTIIPDCPSHLSEGT
jgi:hypothetical protein